MKGGDNGLARYAVLAHFLDQAFRVPGTRLRFGIDALVGLVPGAGDVVGALAGVYGVWVAQRLGAPASLLARMLANLAIDAIVGAIPLLGDLFDFAYKPHLRNVVLLERWLATPNVVRRRSAGLLLGVLVAAIALAGAVLWVTVALIGWLLASLA